MSVRAALAWLGLRHVRVAAFYCYSFFLLGLVIASVGPALDELARRSGQTLDGGAVGVLVTSRSLGYLGASLVGGLVLDRWPRMGNVLIVAGLAVCGLGTAAVTFAYHFVLMCALMTLVGFSAGQLDVCANVLMMKEFDLAAQGEPYVMALHASFAIGAAVSPVFVTKLILMSADGRSFNVPFFCIAGMFLPALIVGAFYIARLPFRPLSDASSEGYKSQTISSRRRFALVALFAVVMMLYVGAEVAFGLYIYTYAHNQTVPMDEIVSGVLNTAFWTAFATGRVLSIVISALKVRPSIMVVGSVVSATVFSIIPFLFRQHWILWTCCIGLGLSMAPTFPAVYTMTAQYMEVTGRIGAAFVVMSAFGEMVIPLLIGVLFSVKWAGFVSLFPVVSICSFVGLLCVMVCLLLTRNVSVVSHDDGRGGSAVPAHTKSQFGALELDEFGGLEDGLQSDTEYDL